MSKLSAVSQDLARAGLCGEQMRSRQICERFDLPDFIMDFTSLMPNKLIGCAETFKARSNYLQIFRNTDSRPHFLKSATFYRA
jgi:hypothetical protein